MKGGGDLESFFEVGVGSKGHGPGHGRRSKAPQNGARKTPHKAAERRVGGKTTPPSAN